MTSTTHYEPRAVFHLGVTRMCRTRSSASVVVAVTDVRGDAAEGAVGPVLRNSVNASS